MQQLICGRGWQGGCYTERLLEFPRSVQWEDPMSELPWQQLTEMWAPGKAACPAAPPLCGRMSGAQSTRPQPLWEVAMSADIDPWRADGVWEGSVVRKGSRWAFWGQEGLGLASTKQAAPTSVSVLGRKVHVIVLVIYCRFLGGHDRIL